MAKAPHAKGSWGQVFLSLLLLPRLDSFLKMGFFGPDEEFIEVML